MMNVNFYRGDLVLVENPLQESHGSVMAGNHYAVVIQNNVGNTHSDNLIVAYLTSKLKRLDMPTHVILQWYDGLSLTSMVQTEQIATISMKDVIKKVDHVRKEDMERIDRAVMASLGLSHVA